MMMYEIEFVRVDDAFDVISVESNSPDEAVDIAMNETELFDYTGDHNFWKMFPLSPDLFNEKFDQWKYFNHDYLENWKSVYSIQYLCKQIIIRDKDGKKLY